MTFSCKLCKYAIKSEKPPEHAPGDLLKKMGEHLGKCHHEYAADVAATFATVQSLVSTYLIFHFVDIPDSETALLNAYRENKEFLYQLLESKPEDLAHANVKLGTVN